MVCEQLLERAGLLSHLEVMECPLGFIPYDTDLLTMEVDFVFKQVFVNGDASSLTSIAAALHRLQLLFGPIPKLWGKGAASRQVVKTMLEMRVDEEEGRFASWSDIEGMVVMDRSSDLISPLLTPLTYESLVDEIIGVEGNRIKIDASIINSSNEDDDGSEEKKGDEEGEVTVVLNSGDFLYRETRGMNIEHLAGYFQKKASDMRNVYADFKENKDASIPDVHNFVKTHMPDLTEGTKALTTHIGIVEKLKETTDSPAFQEQWQIEQGALEGEDGLDYVEEMAIEGKGGDKFRVLRLFALHSIANDGIKASRYDSIRREIVHVFHF